MKHCYRYNEEVVCQCNICEDCPERNHDMIDMELKICLEGLVWQSDWNGDEVGYDDVNVVGLYMTPAEDRLDGMAVYYYIDMDDQRILEFWVDPGDE